MKPRKPRKPRKPGEGRLPGVGRLDIDLTSPDFDGEQLLELLVHHRVVLGTMKLPTPEACHVLAQELGGHALLRARAPEGMAINALKQRFAAALDELVSASTAIRQELETPPPEPGYSFLALYDATAAERPDLAALDATMDGWHVESLESYRADVAAFVALTDAVARMQERRGTLLKRASVVCVAAKRWRTWHQMVGMLAEHFREAMQTSNPSEPFALTDHGAVSRFLAAVVPYVTGETPSGPTIIRHLTRHRKP